MAVAVTFWLMFGLGLLTLLLYLTRWYGVAFLAVIAAIFTVGAVIEPF
jgi:hypothetical protein